MSDPSSSLPRAAQVSELAQTWARCIVANIPGYMGMTPDPWPLEEEIEGGHSDLAADIERYLDCKLTDFLTTLQSREQAPAVLELTSDQLARIFEDITRAGDARAAWDALSEEDRYTTYAMLVEEVQRHTSREQAQEPEQNKI